MFYLALMISIVIGGLTSSMAYMIIPTSSVSNTDFSSSGTRIGLVFTAPLIAALIASPRTILSMIGPQYVPAEIILLVLSFSILPSAITINTVSKFNNLNKPKKLIVIGSVEILAFLVSFFILVPNYGTLGSAFSTLIAFIVSACISLIWSERIIARYIGISIISIIVGSATGRLVGLLTVVGGHDIYPVLQIPISVVITLVIIIALKNTSIIEIGDLARTVLNKR
jgi:O-antigen/teichoic acid export membrane protein